MTLKIYEVDLPKPDSNADPAQEWQKRMCAATGSGGPYDRIVGFSDGGRYIIDTYQNFLNRYFPKMSKENR